MAKIPVVRDRCHDCQHQFRSKSLINPRRFILHHVGPPAALGPLLLSSQHPSPNENNPLQLRTTNSLGQQHIVSRDAQHVCLTLGPLFYAPPPAHPGKHTSKGVQEGGYKTVAVGGGGHQKIHHPFPSQIPSGQKGGHMISPWLQT